MHFAQPNMFYLLWGVILLMLFLAWGLLHRQKIMEKFVQSHLMKEVAIGFGLLRLRLKNIFLILVFILSIAALARPQWGFEWQEIKHKGIDILVAVDTSKSMLAQDVKPNRLERTKLAIKDLVRKLKGDRIGLIAFAGEAFLVCPLTVDYNGFLLSLNDLSIDTIPQGGTNIARAIEETIGSYTEAAHQDKAVIIITDGDNLEGDPIAVAKKASEKGIKIYTIGIGTKEGELIQIPGVSGSTEFLKDTDGNFVKSRLNESLLEKISLITAGAYIKASGAQFGLDLIYEKDLAKLEKRDMESKMERKYYERFQISLALASVLLMVETCLGTRRKTKS